MGIPSRKYASVCVDKRGTRVNATRSGQGGGVLEIHELSREPGDRKQRERAYERRERYREIRTKGKRGNDKVHEGLLEFRNTSRRNARCAYLLGFQSHLTYSMYNSSVYTLF